MSSSVKIGVGSAILANSFIGNGSEIKEHCIINSSSSIDHDNYFESFTSTGPGVITGGNVNVIDGTQKKSLVLEIGTTYIFNHSSNHPLRFSTTSDGTHNNGSEYMNGVTTSAGVTTIEVTENIPSNLYYFCQIHAGMGADITISN